MNRFLTLTLCTLLVSGCAATSGPTVGQSDIKPAPIPLCDCRPLPKPSPITIDPIEPVNAGEQGWLLDNQSYLNNAAFWAQVERYIGETQDALQYWHQCVAACNNKYIEINRQE